MPSRTSRSCKRSNGAVTLLLASALTCAALGPAAAQQWTDVPRVVAFGDVHGAYSPLVELLRATDVVGPDLEWTGGNAHVVSLGDLTDRGPATRQVLDLVMRLQREAAAAGGRFHVVLGNHEVMNLLGDLRYVPPAEYAAFAPEEPAPLRAEAFAAFAAADAGRDTAAGRAQFDALYPPGFFARRAAFSAQGEYGAWLASLPAIIVINDTAFLHGGLSPVVAAEGLDVNAKVRDALARSFADAPELGEDGPLWYRGSVYCKPLLEEATFDAALARLGVARAVVGHTPTGDRRVRALYDGRLVMADTGMLAESFGGRPAALVLERNHSYVQYASPAERAEVETSANPLAYRRTEPELRALLEQAAVLAVDRGNGGRAWRVALRDSSGAAGADTALDAIFYPRNADRTADHELAAAALDELLGTRLVAPTVSREIEGTGGALQLRYPDAISEAERAARGLGMTGWCPIDPQLQLIRAFDLLAATGGRSSSNVVFTNSLSELKVTAPPAGFTTSRSVDARQLDIPEPLLAAVRAADERRLTAALDAWLEPEELQALLARRARFLEIYGERGAARPTPP
jgi:hypothetical protein